MSEKVHYEDNLFYLLTDITRLKNGLKLSIDNEFFSEKLLGDLFFIDTVLSRHYKLLQDNPFLIRRKDYLFTVMKMKKKLTELQESILEKNGFFTDEQKEKFPDIKRSMARHLQDIQSIRQESEPILITPERTIRAFPAVNTLFLWILPRINLQNFQSGFHFPSYIDGLVFRIQSFHAAF